MATLETQYKEFLRNNPDSTFSFNEWKQWYGNQIEQAIINIKKQQKQHLINMMKTDEELGLYDEPNETLNDVALKFAKDHHNLYETSNYGSMYYGFYWGARWQQARSYSEEEVYNIIIDLLKRGYVGQIIDYGEIEEWFDTVKKK